MEGPNAGSSSASFGGGFTGGSNPFVAISNTKVMSPDWHKARVEGKRKLALYNAAAAEADPMGHTNLSKFQFIKAGISTALGSTEGPAVMGRQLRPDLKDSKGNPVYPKYYNPTESPEMQYDAKKLSPTFPSHEEHARRFPQPSPNRRQRRQGRR